MEKIIGILGGMGPEATAELFFRIIRTTPAKADQEHLRIIIDNNPKIPDRTEAILRGGPSPLPELIKTGLNLEKAGAEFIIIPCNTAHHYLQDLANNLHVQVLDMIKLTAEKMQKEYPEIRKVGLIATEGTVKSGIYDRSFSGFGLRVLTPSEGLQKDVTKAIYGHIKSGDLANGRKIVHSVARSLAAEGAQAVICGCTEVSLVIKDGDLPIPVVDPLQILAEAAVAEAVSS